MNTNTIINKDSIYILNPAYKFRNDIKRVILTNNDSLYFNDMDGANSGDSTSYSTIIHPLVAYIFSFFNGHNNFQNTVKKISDLIDYSYEDTEQCMSQFIENEENIVYKLTDNILAPLPKRFLILKDHSFKERDLLEGIDIDEMMQDLDLSHMRYFIPDSMNLMLINKCVTDCVYCYANTKHVVETPLPLERIEELIREARSLNCRDFGLIGGEVLLYKHWPQLIRTLHENNYEPYFSTKIPLNETIISQLKDLGVKRIQISLDTVNKNKLMKMLNVNSEYLDKMKQTLALLDRYKITFRVKSVLTKFNDNIADISALISFLQQFEYLDDLSIATGETSLNKSLEDYKTNITKLTILEDYIKKVNREDKRITMPPWMVSNENLSLEEKLFKHNNRAACAGNLSSFFILPDGKVTLCEQLYWHPFFILGDLTNSSIMDVWNSEKAWSLWNFSQDEVKESSPCKTCSIFENCRRGRGSCWRMTILAYGVENWDYPYPQCPYAPSPTRPFYV